jgi:hypothetical protein
VTATLPDQRDERSDPCQSHADRHAVDADGLSHASNRRPGKLIAATRSLISVTSDLIHATLSLIASPYSLITLQRSLITPRRFLIAPGSQLITSGRSLALGMFAR